MSVPQGPLTSRAPAKINLTLHVLGRRADGYHDLESLVAFAGTADGLSLAPGPELELEVEGPTAPAAGPISDNLVLKAARLLQERVPGLRAGALRLTKRLPVAAGLGGGSSDAAAALRLLARLNGLSLTHPAVQDAARHAGSDVLVCLEGRARFMSGVGEILGEPFPLPPFFAVLINPGVPLETPAVFKAFGLAPGEASALGCHSALPAAASPSALLNWLRFQRNDLQATAMGLEPRVADALWLAEATDGCRLMRMSGSGATVFALYDSCRAAAAAAKTIRREQPAWWVKATVIRG